MILGGGGQDFAYDVLVLRDGGSFGRSNLSKNPPFDQNNGKSDILIDYSLGCRLSHSQK